MRIVTRPDFDGIVCAVLLKAALDIDNPIRWVEPGDLQKGLVEIEPDEIIANLPYHSGCSLWFDHHYSNLPNEPFEGAFEIAPSAAGVINQYYENDLKGHYTELVSATDKIDSADLSLDEVLKPESDPYILLSMTINGQDQTGPAYWNTLVDLLGKEPIEKVLSHPTVKNRCQEAITENSRFRDILVQNTTVKRQVAVTDLRPMNPAPSGNRFLVYSLFPDTVVSVKIRCDDTDRQKVIISAGHSIFNRHCRVNLGQMFSRFEGGGHAGAGACSFHISNLNAYLPKIMEILVNNQPLVDD
ncbi:MAG: exopolyphosphatase [Desulfobacterales bacterium]|nr:exopolyphosphatase [Desulfobacterales bacterium]